MNTYTTTAGVGKAETRNPSTSPVSFRVSHELKEQLTMEAQALQMPFGQYLETLIRKGRHSSNGSANVEKDAIKQALDEKFPQPLMNNLYGTIQNMTSLFNLTPEKMDFLLSIRDLTKEYHEFGWPDILWTFLENYYTASRTNDDELIPGYSFRQIKEKLDPGNKYSDFSYDK